MSPGSLYARASKLTTRKLAHTTSLQDEINRKPVASSKRTGDYVQSMPRKEAKAPDEQNANQLRARSHFPNSTTPPSSSSRTPFGAAGDESIVTISASHSLVTVHDSKILGVTRSPPTPQFRLHLNDTKTRSVRSLPRDDLSGRLQLMLYHQLLGRLISPEALLFPQLFAHLHLNPKFRFSNNLIKESTKLLNGWKLASDGLRPPIECLDDLVLRWYGAVRGLALQPTTPDNSIGDPNEVCCPIDPTLELVYRSREAKGKARKLKERVKVVTRPLPLEADPFVAARRAGPPNDTAEPEQIQLAIAESSKVQQQHDIRAEGESSTTLDCSTHISPITRREVQAVNKVKGVRKPQSSKLKSGRASRDLGVTPERKKPGLLGIPPAVVRDVAEADSTVQHDNSRCTTSALATGGHPQQSEAGSQGMLLVTKLSFHLRCDTRTKTDSHAMQTSPDSSSVQEGPELDAYCIIGTTKFQFDAFILESHLESVMSFWEGRREPRGVELEDTWKCNTCEYRDDCEWREARAIESALRHRVKLTGTS